MAHAEIKNRIIRDLNGDLMDSNHITRRMFRCWLDGSYLGEHHYRSNIADLKAIIDGGERKVGASGCTVGQSVNLFVLRRMMRSVRAVTLKSALLIISRALMSLRVFNRLIQITSIFCGFSRMR